MQTTKLADRISSVLLFNGVGGRYILSPWRSASPLSVTVGPTLHRDASYSGLMFGASSDPLHALFTQSRAESSAWASLGCSHRLQVWEVVAFGCGSRSATTTKLWSSWGFAANASTGPWTTGAFGGLGSFARTALEYDPHSDRFVLIALSNAGTPKTSWTAAIAPFGVRLIVRLLILPEQREQSPAEIPWKCSVSRR